MKTAGVRVGTKEETELVHDLSLCLEDSLACATDDVETGINVLIYTIARLEVKYSRNPMDLEKNTAAVLEGIKANIAVIQKDLSGRKTS